MFFTKNFTGVPGAGNLVTPMNSIALPCFRLAALLVLACAMISCRTRPLVDETKGWKPIFNGKTTEGWQMTGPGELRLEKGELVTYGGMGLLWYSKEKLGDCRLRVIFKPTMSQDNSGVFIRIPEPPKDPWYAVNKGYEVQIENRGGPWHRTGTLYSFSQAKHTVHARVNEWNVMVITLEGKRTLVEVNGVLVTDFSEGDPVPPKTEDHEPDRGLRPNSGYIGLQNHDEKARVHFREVSVAPLR
jgi:hypothetical protein